MCLAVDLRAIYGVILKNFEALPQEGRKQGRVGDASGMDRGWIGDGSGTHRGWTVGILIGIRRKKEPTRQENIWKKEERISGWWDLSENCGTVAIDE